MNKRELSHLIKKVKNTVDKYGLLSPKDGVLLAVSGGPDSVCLADVMSRLAPLYRLRLEIFHLNHLARPSASRDEMFVRKLASNLGLVLTVKQVDAQAYCRKYGYSFQDGARRLRYSLLEETARGKGLNKIATGHIKDDVVETFFMRVIGGSDLRGLGGIPPKRDGRVIRPLIDCSREEILDYLAAAAVEFMIDETNSSDKYQRNRVRRHVTPALSEERDEIGRLILETGELIRREEGALSSSVEHLFNDYASVVDGEVKLPMALLRTADPPVSLRLLTRAVSQTGASSRDSSQGGRLIWEAFQKGIIKGLDIPGGLSVCQDNDQVVIFKATAGGIELRQLQIGLNQNISKNQEIEIVIAYKKDVDAAAGDECLAVVDADKVAWPLSVRSFQHGDRFVPLGMRGRKKVKDFFIDKKIPKRLRGKVPIIVDREKIVWIAGERLDDRVKLDVGTDKVAVIKITARE